MGRGSKSQDLSGFILLRGDLVLVPQRGPTVSYLGMQKGHTSLLG